MKHADRSFVGKSEGRYNLEDLSVDGRIMLDWISENRVGGCGLNSSG
jgi:hypothetical protein